jgi:hypothetical protein
LGLKFLLGSINLFAHFSFGNLFIFIF